MLVDTAILQLDALKRLKEAEKDIAVIKDIFALDHPANDSPPSCD